jgi:integrase
MPKATHAKRELTDKFIRALKPDPSRRQTYPDLMPNFSVRIYPDGTKSFRVVARAKGAANPTTITIGHYPEITLKPARERARQELAMLQAGVTPKMVEASRQHQAAERQQAQEVRLENSFQRVSERFCEQRLPTLRSGKRNERLIGRLLPRWGERPINEIKRRDIIALLEEVCANSGPAAARKTLGTISPLFYWALARDLLEFNPCAQIRKNDLLGAIVKRDRVLSDSEIKLVWHGAQARGYPFGPIVQLLLLTGQRLSEIGNIKRDELCLDKAILTIPADRMKNGTAHVVPLTGTAMQLITELPRLSGPYLFSTNGGASPVSGYSVAKKVLDRAIATLGSVAPWHLHDIRRTVRTGLASLKIPAIVAEMVIAHRQQGIAAVYDLHRYETEKREALEAWAKHLDSVTVA